MSSIISSDAARYAVKTPWMNIVASVYQAVVQVVATYRKPVRVVPISNGRRSWGARLSGSRRLHAAITVTQTTQNQNTAGHGPTATMAAPIDGAMMGTSMNTAMIWDMALAMATPSK